MKEEQFDEIVQEQLTQCEQTLLVKAKEYRRGGNPFHNFEVGAIMTGSTREEVLFGFLLKHLISVQDIRGDIKKGILPKESTLDEKYGDIINYLILEKAMILEKIREK